MRNKFGTLCMFLGAALIFGALALFLYNRQEAEMAEQSAAAVLVLLVEELETVEETEPMPELAIPEEFLTAEDCEMPEVVVDGQPYIGYLSLPTLELQLPVMADWSYKKLQSAPCRYYGSLRGNDLVVMAHNYAKHFGRIDQLETGDPVWFTDMSGAVTEYAVVERDILSPYAVEELTMGTYDLSLFTCTYNGRSRVVVYCDRVK